MYIGCHTEEILPGGLNVRQAFNMHQNLMGYLITVTRKRG
jgi:L-serine dehydratase